jgi:hypothetical protein
MGIQDLGDAEELGAVALTDLLCSGSAAFLRRCSEETTVSSSAFSLAFFSDAVKPFLHTRHFQPSKALPSPVGQTGPGQPFLGHVKALRTLTGQRPRHATGRNPRPQTRREGFCGRTCSDLEAKYTICRCTRTRSYPCDAPFCRPATVWTCCLDHYGIKKLQS